MHTAVFEVLADPTRRRIVELLRSGEHAVNDIVEKVGIDQSGVSRHLHILHQAASYKSILTAPSASTRSGQSPSAS